MKKFLIALSLALAASFSMAAASAPATPKQNTIKVEKKVVKAKKVEKK